MDPCPYYNMNHVHFKCVKHVKITLSFFLTISSLMKDTVNVFFLVALCAHDTVEAIIDPTYSCFILEDSSVSILKPIKANWSSLTCL